MRTLSEVTFTCMNVEGVNYTISLLRVRVYFLVSTPMYFALWDCAFTLLYLTIVSSRAHISRNLSCIAYLLVFVHKLTQGLTKNLFRGEARQVVGGRR